MKVDRRAVWPLLLGSVIFLASGRSNLATPEVDFSLLIPPDKIGHFLIFGLLATAVIRTKRFRQSGWQGALLAGLLVSLYGVLDEAHQFTTPGRAVELADIIADCCGAFVASILYHKSTHYRRWLEYPISFRLKHKAQ